MRSTEPPPGSGAPADRAHDRPGDRPGEHGGARSGDRVVDLLVERPVDRLIDHLFRQQSGRLVAMLVRYLGGRHLDLAEEVVQDVLVTALQQWPFHGVPDSPEAWLTRAARNRAIDRLRRDRAFADRVPALTHALAQEEDRANAADPDADLARRQVALDDDVCLLFMACHPELPREARLALTLKTVGGLGVAEIARAFLAQESTIAQRLVRAKQRLRDRGPSFELPGAAELPARLDSVLDVLSLIFNEGYSAHAGEVLVRRDLCETAIRLCQEVAEHPVTGQPKTHALLALLCFQAARLGARTDADGALFLLEDQDRTRWDGDLTVRGFHALARAGQGSEVTTWHLQAGIASLHAIAPSVAETDWPRILDFYDRLLALQPSPIVVLNRTVALSKVDGPRAGLAALEPLRADPALRRYHLFHAVLGALSADAGDRAEAAEHYRAALRCQCSDPERRFLAERLAALDPSR